MRRTIRLVFAAAAAFLALAPGAEAQYERTKSTLVLADRVEIPGAILEPGNYLVRIADRQANRNVIVFQSPDGSRTFATTIATPHRGARPPKETEFTFLDMPDGQPRVLRSWFAANDPDGQDFHYPPERAAEFKRLTNEEIPVAAASMTATTEPEPVAAAAPAPAPPPPAAPVTLPSDAAAATNASASGTDGDALPQTASPYPLLAGLGVTSLAAAVALGRRRRAA